MELSRIIALVLWIVVGVLNLAKIEEISKVSYFLCWLVLIIELINNCLQ